MRSLEGRIKKLEANGSPTDARFSAVLYKIVPVRGEYQRVKCVESESTVIRREGETEDQFFERAQYEIRALTDPKEKVITMIADDGEEN